MCDWNHTRCQPEVKNGGVSLLGYLGFAHALGPQQNINQKMEGEKVTVNGF